MIQALYNRTLRPFLLEHHHGRKYRTLAGVPVRNAALLDHTDQVPEYKRSLAALVREYVHEGDDVLEIGGGRGVMTTIAAERGAAVRSFEPAAPMVELMEDTLQASGVRERVHIERVIVGELASEAYGPTAGAATLSPEELPACDVLIMDCEGAEYPLLSGMNVAPNRIIVETHPNEYDGPADLQAAAGSEYELAEVRQLEPGSPRHAVLLQREVAP